MTSPSLRYPRFEKRTAYFGLRSEIYFLKVGADLSFAIAMLDAEDNGIVLNGIYSRDGSYVYSKPVQNGQSTYQLSDEEKEAIRLAKENNKAIA